jgi:hypothetical protein
MRMFLTITSTSQVCWCMYSVALGSSTDQDMLYKKLCKRGEEK